MMKYRELDNNQIRFLTDIRQTYQTFLDAKQAMARLIDSRKQLKLLITDPNIAESGILGILSKADKTFKKLGSQSYTAANDQGFMVDLIKPALNPPWKKDALLKPADADLVPVEIPNLEWLLLSQKCTSIVVDTTGMPAKMVCPDPRAFAVHKKWISTQAHREAEKRSRDSFQAQAVIELTASKFTHLALNKAELSYFPDSVLDQSKFEFDL